MKTEGQAIEVRATSSGLDSPVRAKVAIVTGASRGIGRGIAERLLDTGYGVVANSRNITTAKTLLKLVDGDYDFNLSKLERNYPTPCLGNAGDTECPLPFPGAQEKQKE